ncbi:auxin efflux carrier component 1b-related [Anaeramoeba flamelloides]|uniref:Auxin efflux carrier component 1b-related n=1 Tax=Anaeramoeba flamelloides TaxID=1746091 RepID=A0ABQ8YZZ6_9EUKA|nr:auxin efflux carrier component 1b-related [Anaeramoeba flamelloides]
MYLSLINEGLTILILIFAGYLITRLKVIEISILRQFNSVVFYFGIPGLLFGVISGIGFSEINWKWCGVYAVFMMVSQLFVVFVGWFMNQRDLAKISTNLFALTWTNNIIFGMPIMEAIFGKDCLIYPILATIPNWFFQMPMMIFFCENLRIKRNTAAKLKEIKKTDINLKEISLSNQEESETNILNKIEIDDDNDDENEKIKENDMDDDSNIGESDEDDKIQEINEKNTKETPQNNHQKHKNGQKEILIKTFIKVFKTPIIVSVFLSFLYSLIGYPLPELPKQCFQYLANIVLPLALITIGIFVYREKIISCGIKEMLIILIAKSFVIPLISIAIWYAFGFNNQEGKIGFIISTMPAAIATFNFATEYQLGQRLISTCLIVETFIMVPVISLWFLLIDALGLFQNK